MAEKCLKCRAERLEGAKFCASCGAEFEKEAVCPSCGCFLLPDQELCADCNTKTKPTDIRTLESDIWAGFVKLFPNFLKLKVEPKQTYWIALIGGSAVAAFCGVLVVFAIEITAAIFTGGRYYAPDFALVLSVGWLVNVFVFLRLFGHILIGQVVDIEPKKQRNFNKLGWLYVLLALLGTINFEFVAISYLVLFGASIYLGSLPSYTLELAATPLDITDDSSFGRKSKNTRVE